MNKLSMLVSGALITTFAFSVMAAKPLPRATPESAQTSSAEVLKYVEALDSQVEGMHSLIIVRNGNVIAEGWWTPYKAESRHTMYSLSKSFASTAVGMAQAEGKLSVDDTVVSFFPDLVPANASQNLKAMRVRDLLAMSTGHHNEDIAKFDYVSEDAVKQFLAIPVAHKPGTHFVYNTPASFMLSAIVQKVTGQSVRDYLQPRLFEPLGIDDPVWDAGKTGISLGGFGLHIRTEDIAKFGLLYLRGGDWNGKSLLPQDWVRAATMRQTSNGSNPKSDWDQGYGYQFWRCRNGGYRGDGAFGQYCIVLPNEQTVVAITSGVKDMQKVLDVTWDNLLPALRSSSKSHEDKKAQAALKAKLAGLKMRGVEGDETSAIAQEVSGKKFKFAENDLKLEAVSIERFKAATDLNLTLNGKTYKVHCARDGWSDAKLAWPVSSLEKVSEEVVSSTGAWNGNTLTAKVAFTETPFVLTLKCDFSKDQVTIDPEMNVAFGPTKKPQIVGRAE